MTPGAWTTLIAALARVEALPPDASGILSFGEPPFGAIFVDRGRVCWVAADGLQRRLRDLLQHHAAIPDAALDSVYERCRREGRLLGETLVAEGWLSTAALEAALRAHSAESLIVLCARPAPLTWTPRLAAYHPEVSFAPLDLLGEVIASAVPDEAAAAAGELAALDLPDVPVAVFAADPTGDALRPVAFRDSAATVDGLVAMSAWARALPLAAHELGVHPRLALASTTTGDSVLGWWRQGLLFAVVPRDRGQLALVTSRCLAIGDHP